MREHWSKAVGLAGVLAGRKFFKPQGEYFFITFYLPEIVKSNRRNIYENHPKTVVLWLL
jgi:hypothetical protein